MNTSVGKKNEKHGLTYFPRPLKGLDLLRAIRAGQKTFFWCHEEVAWNLEL